MAAYAGLMIYNKVPFGVARCWICVCLCVCVSLHHWEQGTLQRTLMMSLSFPKTVSQCQRWEKIISLHTVNESQRLSQPFLREAYYSAHRLWASLITCSLPFFSSATCGHFQHVVILFFSFSNFGDEKLFSPAASRSLLYTDTQRKHK